MLYAKCWIPPEKRRKAKSAGSSCSGACRHLRMYASLFLQRKKNFSERRRRFSTAVFKKRFSALQQILMGPWIVPAAALAQARVPVLLTTGTGREPASLPLRD